jgi:hypothetical protein
MATTKAAPVEWSIDFAVPNANAAKELVAEFKRHALFYGAKKPFVREGKDKWTAGATFADMKTYSRYTGYLTALLNHIQPAKGKG